MIDREFALRLVRDELDRDQSLRLVITWVEEHELAWVVYYQSAKYVRTKDPMDMLVGTGPYLVDREDGGLHLINYAAVKSGEWEADYRRHIRKLPVRTAVDELHEEIREFAAAHSRVPAARLLRARFPELPSAGAHAYVTALQSGGPPPAPFLAIVTRKLVPPRNAAHSVHTVREGQPHAH
ncbi:YrhB domain-containing protein [Streptomyces sp. NPDC003077]|uniref:YrhB domain-containing protein n=1 Tax=Streptomyces sp. NPDC003077 TaxID=3154443 RepID=UPI0033A31A05